MDMYDRIRKRRKELGMTQDELARLTGYNDRSSIAKIEAKKADLSQSKIIAFSEALKVTTSYLMDESKEEELTSQEKDIFSQLTEDELVKLEKFKNMSTVMFMNEGNQISDNDKRTLAIAYAEVLISQRKKWCVMTTKSIINTALKHLKEYSSIYKFIKENGLIIKYVDLEENIKGLTLDNIIFINSNMEEFEKEFVIAHEIGHYVLHDDTIR